MSVFSCPTQVKVCNKNAAALQVALATIEAVFGKCPLVHFEIKGYSEGSVRFVELTVRRETRVLTCVVEMGLRRAESGYYELLGPTPRRPEFSIVVLTSSASGTELWFNYENGIASLAFAEAHAEALRRFQAELDPNAE